MNNPLVSIITPSFNRIKFLEPCLQSILAQNYPNIEHVIVDGGSTDGTVDVLARYQKEYPHKIRYISEPDRGAGEALNKGLALAKGDIFSFLCSDDLLVVPEAIKTVVNFFHNNQMVCFVYGRCTYVDEQVNVLYTSELREVTLDILINEDNYIPFPSAFFKREVIQRVGPFDTYGNDLFYMIKVARSYQIYSMDNVLSLFRIHKDSETGGTWFNYIKVLKKDIRVSRMNGGRFFSGYRKRYYKEIIKGIVVPIFSFAKRFINNDRP